MEAPWCSIDVCFSLCFCMSTICKTRQAASRCFLSLGGSFISLGICIENMQCCFGNEKHVLLKQCEANSFETDRKTTSRLTVLMQAHSLVSLLLFVLKMTKNKETQVTLYGDTALSHGCIKEKRLFLNVQCVLMSFRRKKEMALLRSAPALTITSRPSLKRSPIHTPNLEY